jgi:hypothetical protein
MPLLDGIRDDDPNLVQEKEIIIKMMTKIQFIFKMTIEI